MLFGLTRSCIRHNLHCWCSYNWFWSYCRLSVLYLSLKLCSRTMQSSKEWWSDLQYWWISQFSLIHKSLSLSLQWSAWSWAFTFNQPYSATISQSQSHHCCQICKLFSSLLLSVVISVLTNAALLSIHLQSPSSDLQQLPSCRLQG